MKIFDLDGPIYRIGSEIADVMIVTFFWILGCLPIFTIGASTAAAYYIYGKKMRGEDTYVAKDFFKSFKQNFKQSFAVTFILAILWVSASLYLMMILFYQGNAPIYVTALALFFCLEVMAITIYSLALISRFYMKVAGVFMTSFVLLHKHLLSTFTMLALNVALTVASLSAPVLLVFIPICNIGINSFFLQKLFKKHIESGMIQQSSDEEQIGDNALEEDFFDTESAKGIIDKEDADGLEKDSHTTENNNNNDDDENDDKDFLKYI